LRRIKRTLGLLGIIAAGLLVIVVSLPFLVDANRFRGLLESRLTGALGREVKVGDLKLALLSGGVAASDLSIAEDPAFGRTPFVRAKSLKAGVELWPLLVSRRLHVTGLSLDEPQIALLQSAGGKWNFSGLGAGASPGAQPPARSPDSSKEADLDLRVKLVKIVNGRVTLRRAGSSQPQVFDKVNLQVRDFSARSVFPFSLSAWLAGGGKIELDGRAGPVNPSDAVLTPVEATVAASHIDLTASGFVDASAGVAGLVSVNGGLQSNGQSARIEGRLNAGQLKLARRGTAARRPVAVDWVIEHDTPKRSGTLKRGDIHIGAAAASLTGTYDLRTQSPTLNMKLSGLNMPLPELVAMLPALDIVLPSGSSIEGGTASVRLALEGPANRLLTSGTLSVENARLLGFDLGSKVAAVARLAGIRSGPDTDIKVFSATVRSAPDGSSVDDIRLVAPAIGELTGAGVISPGHALNFKMKAVLHTSGSLMAALGQKGDATIPFLIQGAASQPVFKPDVRGLASEQIDSLLKGDTRRTAGDLLKGLLGGRKEKKP